MTTGDLGKRIIADNSDPNREDGSGSRNDRESIWSVERRTKNLYFALFIVQSIVGIGLVAWRAILQNKGPLETAVTIWQDSATIIAASAGTAIIIAEAWRYIVVLARALEERLERARKKRREEDRAKGRAEERAKWEAWNNRRMAAERDNKPFDEPPPSAEQQQTS